MKEGLLAVGLVTRSLAVLASLGVLLTSPVLAVDPERGKLLYENTCDTCHESTLHVRDKRKARSFAQIQAQVIRWSTAAKADWTFEEVLDVTDYLNTIYYRYPCEPEQCSFTPG